MTPEDGEAASNGNHKGKWVKYVAGDGWVIFPR